MKGLAFLAVALAFVSSPALAGPETGKYTLPELDQMEAESIPPALAWLAKRQEEDGRWTSSASGSHDFTRLYEPDAAKASDVMTTSVALLAFLGSGSTPWAGPYQTTVQKAHTWLIRQLDAKGSLVGSAPDDEGTSLSDRERAARRGHVARLNQLWGTLALAEVVASVDTTDIGQSVSDADKQKRRKVVMDYAVNAIKFVALDPSEKPKRFDFLNEQTINMDEIALLGAIRHCAGQNRIQHDKDFFVTALERHKKIHQGMTEDLVPWKYSEEGEYWFNGSVSTPQSMIGFVYFRVTGGGSMRHMQSAAPALLAHPPTWNPYYSILRPTGHPEASGEKAVVKLPGELRRVAGSWRDDVTNEAAWFWQGMAFRSMAGDEWNQWRNSFVPVAHAHQRRGGMESGSWDPTGPHARVFGREVSTAWLTITLQSKCKLQMAKSNWQELKSDPRQDAREENLGGMQKKLVNCAVCGIETFSDTVFSKGRGAVTYYFCSEECQHKYEMNPEPYLKGEGVEEGGDRKKEEEGSEGSHK